VICHHRGERARNVHAVPRPPCATYANGVCKIAEGAYATLSLRQSPPPLLRAFVTRSLV
jgi:hypothetical protein